MNKYTLCLIAAMLGMVLTSLAKYGEMERTLERYEKPAVADTK